MPFVAIINTPGYLPDSDGELPTFDTAAEAWKHLADERNSAWNDTEDMGPDFDPVMDLMGKRAASDLVCDFEKVGTIYGPTPGYDGDHDLGLAYCVEWVEPEPDLVEEAAPDYTAPEFQKAGAFDR